MKFCRSGNWNYPFMLSEYPRKCDLCRCGSLALCECGDAVDEGLIRFTILFRKSRHGVAEIVGREGGILVDLSGQETFTEWTKRHETDAELFERGQNLLLGLAPPKRVFVLQSRHGLHRV